MDPSEHQVVQIIVGNFLKDFFNEHGYQWNPPVYSATGISTSNDPSSLVPNVTERKIIDALLLTARKLSATFNPSLNRTIRQTVATSNLAYDDYATIANELFSQGIEWSHIVTLFLFSAQLAVILVTNGGLRSSNVLLTESQTFNMLYNWLVKYVSSNVSVALWIRSHGSWMGITEYADSLCPPSLYTSFTQKLLPFTNSFKPIYAIGASVASIAAITVFWMVNKDGLLYKK